jgi:hypothetical protein
MAGENGRIEREWGIGGVGLVGVDIEVLIIGA